MIEHFRSLARSASIWLGSAPAFIVACAAIVTWVATGPLFGFSDTWQLVINTGTTIVTFLMVFVIQNSQNRDTQAIQLKLDELIRSLQHARNRLINLEDCSEEELQALQEQFQKVREKVGPDSTSSPNSMRCVRPGARGSAALP